MEAERLTVPVIRNVILNFFEQRGTEVQKTVEDNAMTLRPTCDRTVYLLQNEQISKILTVYKSNTNLFKTSSYSEKLLEYIVELCCPMYSKGKYWQEYLKQGDLNQTFLTDISILQFHTWLKFLKWWMEPIQKCSIVKRFYTFGWDGKSKRSYFNCKCSDRFWVLYGHVHFA